MFSGIVESTGRIHDIVDGAVRERQRDGFTSRPRHGVRALLSGSPWLWTARV